MARNLDPAAAAQAWASRVGQSGAKWSGGIANPRRNPNADPAAMTANWAAGVAAAQPAYSAGVSNSNFVAKWQAGAKAKQASYTGAGAAHQQVMQAALAKVFPMITQASSSLPPKGPAGTNSARAQAFGEAMHALKGQGKAR